MYDPFNTSTEQVEPSDTLDDDGKTSDTPVVDRTDNKTGDVADHDEPNMKPPGTEGESSAAPSPAMLSAPPSPPPAPPSPPPEVEGNSPAVIEGNSPAVIEGKTESNNDGVASCVEIENVGVAVSTNGVHVEHAPSVFHDKNNRENPEHESTEQGVKRKALEEGTGREGGNEKKKK